MKDIIIAPHTEIGTLLSGFLVSAAFTLAAGGNRGYTRNFSTV